MSNALTIAQDIYGARDSFAQVLTDKTLSFEREAENFRREGKERLQRVGEKKPYSDFERRMLDSPSMAPRGSANKLMQEYNSLVFQSNRQ